MSSTETPSWYRRLASVLRGVSTLGRERKWRHRLQEVNDAVRERRFERIDPLLQSLEQFLESFPLGEDLPAKWNRLGDLFQELSGSMQDSERLYRRALALAEIHPGCRAANLALSLNNLGLLLLHQRRYGEAAPVFERLLPLVEEQFGADNPEVATCLENLAAAYRGLGRDEEARERRSRAVSIRRQTSPAVVRSPGRPGAAPPSRQHRFRIWTAGLLAGAVLAAGEALLNVVLLGGHWTAAADQLALDTPPAAGLAIVFLLTLLLGPLMVWLYTRLGGAPGQDSRAAVVTGLAIWFPAFGYPCAWLGVMGVFPAGMLVVEAVWGLGETVLAALLGAWWYRRGL